MKKIFLKKISDIEMSQILVRVDAPSIQFNLYISYQSTVSSLMMLLRNTHTHTTEIHATDPSGTPVGLLWSLAGVDVDVAVPESSVWWW